MNQSVQDNEQLARKTIGGEKRIAESELFKWKQWITYDESVIIDEWNYAYQIVQILIMNQELGDVKWVKMNHFIQSDWETQMSWTLRIYQNS